MNANEAAWFHFWEGLATFGFLLVIVGCVIEGVEHFKKFKRGENAKKHLIEKIGWFILIAGLAIEFLGDKRAKGIADRENARLTLEAAQAHEIAGEANKRAALVESNNLVLRSNVFALARLYDQSTNALAEAKARLEQTSLQLSTAKVELAAVTKTAEEAKKLATPKSLPERIWISLKRIDPNFPALFEPAKAGGMNSLVSAELTAGQIDELSRLCAEPDGPKYIQLIQGEAAMLQADGNWRKPCKIRLMNELPRPQ